MCWQRPTPWINVSRACDQSRRELVEHERDRRQQQKYAEYVAAYNSDHSPDGKQRNPGMVAAASGSWIPLQGTRWVGRPGRRSGGSRAGRDEADGLASAGFRVAVGALGDAKASAR